MAEERFIDDDKNRKYRIRINEAGEEELEIIDSGEEDGEQELVEVEDDALLDRLAQEFEAHFVELYPDEDEAFGEDS